jgi:hypothetical protein
MPKPETDIEYHVSLRAPIYIKLGGISTPVRVFDATTAWEPGLLGDSIIFITDRIWSAREGVQGERRDVVLRTTLTIPADNIAGMVPQPFVER